MYVCMYATSQTIDGQSVPSCFQAQAAQEQLGRRARRLVPRARGWATKVLNAFGLACEEFPVTPLPKQNLRVKRQDR